MKTKTSIIILLLITTNIVLYIMFMQDEAEGEVIDLLSNQASAIYIGISAVLMLIVMCNIIIENGKAKQ